MHCRQAAMDLPAFPSALSALSAMKWSRTKSIPLASVAGAQVFFPECGTMGLNRSYQSALMLLASCANHDGN